MWKLWGSDIRVEPFGFKRMGSDIRVEPFGFKRMVSLGKSMSFVSRKLWFAIFLQNSKLMSCDVDGVDFSKFLKLSLQMNSSLMGEATTRPVA
ncbi:hypothetical protein RJT34_07788 [Clitoria ternatea]|uniref:Uncharacterized protein n=1 Tax=Clitoria ternatea TaxID=43366 RepID=A0AAN9K3P4_CLITE